MNTKFINFQGSEVMFTAIIVSGYTGTFKKNVNKKILRYEIATLFRNKGVK